MHALLLQEGAMVVHGGTILVILGSQRPESNRKKLVDVPGTRYGVLVFDCEYVRQSTVQRLYIVL